MRTKILIVVIAIVAGIGSAWILFHRQPSVEPIGSVYGFDRSQNVLPEDVRKVLDSGERFVLRMCGPLARQSRHLIVQFVCIDGSIYLLMTARDPTAYPISQNDLVKIAAQLT